MERCLAAQLSRGLPGARLVIERGKNPLLQNVSKVRLYFAKYQPHARRFYIEDGCLGLEVFLGVLDFQQNRVLKFKRSGSLQETPAQA
jgi:hypothetical protein